MGNDKCEILLKDITHIKRYFLAKEDKRQRIKELENQANGLHSPSLDSASGGVTEDGMKKAIYIDKKEKYLQQEEQISDYINSLFKLVANITNEKVKSYLIGSLILKKTLSKLAKELNYKKIENADEDALNELKKIDQEIIDTIIEKREKLTDLL